MVGLCSLKNGMPSTQFNPNFKTWNVIDKSKSAVNCTDTVMVPHVLSYDPSAKRTETTGATSTGTASYEANSTDMKLWDAPLSKSISTL